MTILDIVNTFTDEEVFANYREIQSVLDHKFNAGQINVLTEQHRKAEIAARITAEEQEFVEQWVAKNLKPGMIVRVKFSSRNIWRLVESFWGNQFTARVLKVRKMHDPSTGESTVTYDKGVYVTTHSFGDVISIMDDSGNEINLLRDLKSR